ncbi:hypothetical protein GA0061078_0650 [Bifidobacterium bohemicum]|uniref:Uncharacterized protein n=1 Tax=Bifidobacterium bohemicum DSM 22767 TaxID=1437606 RepID=A0A086ZK46_9BIFI|nr:hypothetical protein BBOH_0370 [Bifidobacterium bohemicum DSM 22767]SCB84329.1 hypothetical protein GA0061078_0650 [Bifidobacterium bohemicum]
MELFGVNGFQATGSITTILNSVFAIWHTGANSRLVWIRSPLMATAAFRVAIMVAVFRGKQSVVGEMLKLRFWFLRFETVIDNSLTTR